VSTREAATLEALLEGVALPADKRALVRYARAQSADGKLLSLLDRLPDGEYGSLDEVGEALVPVQPSWRKPQADVPKAESGEPPGRSAYTR
jgi:hypothetical protein